MILNTDVLGIVKSFLGDESYASLAPVSHDWKLWGSRSKNTRAIVSGTSVKMLQYAFGTGLEKTEDLAEECASLGRLDLLKLCIDTGCPCGSRVVSSGSEHSHIVKWMVQNGYQMDYTVCAAAAGMGSIGVLKWAVRNGYPLDSYTFIAAAKKGYLDIMKYLLFSGCPWIEYTCECAAENGHLNALEWLVLNGCPLDYSSVYDIACKKGHTDIVDWLKRNCKCNCSQCSYQKTSILSSVSSLGSNE